MIDKSVPFIVRRARLLLGMTVAEFAGLYGVTKQPRPNGNAAWPIRPLRLGRASAASP